MSWSVGIGLVRNNPSKVETLEVEEPVLPETFNPQDGHADWDAAMFANRRKTEFDPSSANIRFELGLTMVECLFVGFLRGSTVAFHEGRL